MLPKDKKPDFVESCDFFSRHDVDAWLLSYLNEHALALTLFAVVLHSLNSPPSHRFLGRRTLPPPPGLENEKKKKHAPLTDTLLHTLCNANSGDDQQCHLRVLFSRR